MMLNPAERSLKMRPAERTQGISDLEVFGDLNKNYFAGVIGKGTRWELIKVKSGS